MNSLPTIEQVNIAMFHQVVRQFDPELYLIKVALDETGVDPMVLIHIIRGLGNLSLGAGYGRLQVHMQARIITDIEATEKIKVNQEVAVDK